jgi:hypothetical protein
MNERLKQLIQQHWHPKPIDPPAPDADVKDLTGPQRSAEVFRYSILSVEWWLSPNGKLREWLRLNGKISGVLLIPAVLVIPLVTFILWQAWTWTGWLVAIAGNLILFPLAALVALGVLLGVIALLRSIIGK